MRWRVGAAALLTALLVLVGGGGTAAAPPAWEWPVPAPHPVLRGFEAPATPYAPGHRGIDVDAGAGSVVTAPDDGVVAFAGPVANRGAVSIDHAQGVRSSFEAVDPLVRAGEQIRRGQPIATVASGGTHEPGVLHIGARLAGAYVSPLLFLGGLERAVLLPLATFPG